MGKSAEQQVNAEQEFASLERSLNQTADEASNCLRLLEKELSDYDSRHSSRTTSPAKSYLESDIRAANGATSKLKDVAHQISRNHNPSQAEIDSARSMMGATTKAMDALKSTARNYDRENDKSTGIKGKIEDAVGKKEYEKDNTGGVLGQSKHHEDHAGRIGTADTKRDKDGYGNHGGPMVGNSDNVESLVKAVLRGHFNITPLSHQIDAAEKALKPSIMDKAKDKMHHVKDKMKGEQHPSTHEDYRTAHPVNP